MGTPSRFAIGIVDDHALFRQGLRSLLNLQPEVTVVGEAERVDDIVPMLIRTRCDILLLDLMMDRNVLGHIAELATRTSVVVLTADEHPEPSLTAIREGARAVVFKRFAVDTLMEAVRSVAAGEMWLPPVLLTHIASGLRAAGDPLTPREREVARLVALGLRNGEVAQKLFVSDETVKTHLNNIFRKLKLRDRVELTLYAVRAGLVGVHAQSP